MFQTHLIIGGTPEKRRQEAIKLRDTRLGKPIDTISIPPNEDVSIKIEHVREVQQNVSLRPLVSKVKTVIFFEMERASMETQHALLKLLEEPPSFVLIIMTAAKKESLLPTILSRTIIQKIRNTTEDFDWAKHYTVLQDTLNEEDKKFSHGSEFDTKEKAIDWLQTTLTSLHQKLLYDHSKQKAINQPYVQFIKKTNRALNTLQTTNTNPRLLMENLLLELDLGKK